MIRTESNAAPIAGFRQVSVILRGEPEPINQWIREWNASRTSTCLLIIVAGTGIYGAAMGYWRGAEQAVFTAIKFPLIILLTTLGNGLLNGMLAPLLGIDMTFRQSLQAVLMSFMITGAILGSFSPVVFFLTWNAPPMSAHVRSAYAFIQLTHVVLIAIAGIAANLRLGQLLHNISGNVATSRRVLFAWLAGNLLLGSQLSWILRPFFGSPILPTQFLRPDAFHGNFYEAVFRALRQILSQ